MKHLATPYDLMELDAPTTESISGEIMTSVGTVRLPYTDKLYYILQRKTECMEERGEGVGREGEQSNSEKHGTIDRMTQK